MLEFNKVNKYFPGVHALKDIDFKINDGEIIGLVGENGAGKSTLMKVIYGAYQHDDGQVLIDNNEIHLKNPRQAMEKGIGMVFQEQSLIPNIKVMENIFLGFEDQFANRGIIDWNKMSEAARHQLAKVKLNIDPAILTSKLSFAQRQLVELAKVLTLEERVAGKLVILLDEPTSVLARKEVELLFSLVRELKERASFIFVSHRLDEIIELSDRIYVMKDGQVVDVMSSDQADVEAIQRKMVGRDIDKEYFREEQQQDFKTDQVLLSLNNLSHEPKYSNTSFELHQGEVLALVGTEGSGREAILRTIFGLEKPTSGEMILKGQIVKRFSPINAVEHGIGYIPRERKIEGVVGGMNVYENMTLSQLKNYSRSGLLNHEQEKATANEWIKKLMIKTPSAKALLRNLSGGNQQKVVLSKWRSGGSDIILLDHPTRGLDIGAKEDVYEMIRAMSRDNCGIILIADTLEEAIGLAHTLIVFKDGKTQKVFPWQGIEHKPSLFDLIHYMV